MNFCVVQGIRFGAKARHAGESDGRGGDEAAAKDEGHDRYDKERQVKGQIGRKQQLAGQ